jgi:hypothetical protein
MSKGTVTSHIPSLIVPWQPRFLGPFRSPAKRNFRWQPATTTAPGLSVFVVARQSLVTMNIARPEGW